jgi:cytochrome c-type biogenesis protein
VAMVIAFAAGVVSFLSPCVLPLVPAYLSFVTGMSAGELAQHEPRAATPRARSRVALGSIGFVLGAAVVFVSFGALFGSFGRALRDHALGLAQIFGVVTILLGLVMAGVLDRVAPLQRDVRVHRVPGRGLAAAPILGFTFALGWTPCIGPTLGTVLGLSASTDGATAARGAVLSVAYCLGLGLPLLATGLVFTRAMKAVAAIKRHYRTLMVVSGLGLVALGVLQLTGVWTTWTGGLQTRFGGWELPL